MKIHFIAKYKVDKTISSTIAECVEYCRSKNYLGLDIETSVNEKFRHLQTKVHKGGLDPYLSKIVLLQIGDLKRQYVIDVRDYTQEELQPLLDVINYNDDITFIGQNLRFESKHLLHKYGILLKKVHDTMICELILCNGLSMKVGLADLAVKYLKKKKAVDYDLFNMPANTVVTMDEDLLREEGRFISPFELAENKIIDKSTRLEFINIADKPVTYKQIEYSADDIIDPILIGMKQRKGRQLKDGEIYAPIKSYNLENAMVPLLGEAELFGIYIDVDKWIRLYKKSKANSVRVYKILTEYINKEHPKFAGQFNMFTNEVDCKIQWSSSKQVIGFYKYLGKCPKGYSKQTEKEEYTVSAVSMLKTLPLDYVDRYNRLNEVDTIETLEDFSLMYLIYKAYEQASTTFGKDWLRHVHPITGRIHTSYVQLVSTGRMASRSPNMQNIPNSGDHRDCFTLTKDKDWLINADYSNMEVRCLADVANETYMLHFFNTGDEYFGDDFHSYTATLIDRTKYNDNTLLVEPKELPEGGKNPKFTEEDSNKRTLSKAVTFGLAFGKSIRGFAEEFRTTLEATEVFVNDYYNAYPGLQKWFRNQHYSFEKKGYIVIDPITDFRWFCEEFEDLKRGLEEVKDSFPESYNYMGTKERKEFRDKDFFIDHPDLHKKWKDFYRVMSAWKRKSQNAPVQGTAARITKTSSLYLRKELIEKGLYIKHVNFTNIVHDEIILGFTENPVVTKEQVGSMLEDNMEKGGKYFNKRIKHIGTAELIKEWAH